MVFIGPHIAAAMWRAVNDAETDVLDLHIREKMASDIDVLLSFAQRFHSYYETERGEIFSQCLLLGIMERG